MHWRFSSIDKPRSFFEPFQFHLELADLPEQFVLLGLGYRTVPVMWLAKDLRKTGQSLFLPFRDQIRIDVIQLRWFCDRLLRLDRPHRDPCFQIRRIALARNRHSRFLSFPARRIILSSVSNFRGPPQSAAMRTDPAAIKTRNHRS